MSRFKLEAEFLLPPGRFTLHKEISPGVFSVSFTPKIVNFNALERNANKKYTYTETRINNGNNSSWKTRRNLNRALTKRELTNALKRNIEKFNNIELQHAIKYNNSPEWHKKFNLIQKMKNRIQKLSK
jgi:hypothetical protein